MVLELEHSPSEGSALDLAMLALPLCLLPYALQCAPQLQASKALIDRWITNTTITQPTGANSFPRPAAHRPPLSTNTSSSTMPRGRFTSLWGLPLLLLLLPLLLLLLPDRAHGFGFGFGGGDKGKEKQKEADAAAAPKAPKLPKGPPPQVEILTGACFF